jgi:hypothetical protein
MSRQATPVKLLPHCHSSSKALHKTIKASISMTVLTPACTSHWRTPGSAGFKMLRCYDDIGLAITGRVVCCAYATPYATRQSQGKRLSLSAFECLLSGDTESAIVSVSGSFTPAPRCRTLLRLQEQKAQKTSTGVSMVDRGAQTSKAVCPQITSQGRAPPRRRNASGQEPALRRALLALLVAALSKSATSAPAKCGLRGHPHDPSAAHQRHHPGQPR